VKILMLVLHFPPAYRGGAELQCWKQARALAARGHEVTLLTEWFWVRSARREIQEDVTIRRMGVFLPVTTAVRRLHRWLRSKRTVSAPDNPDPFSADSAQPNPGSGRKIFRWMAPVEWLGHLSFILEAGLAAKLGCLKADVVHVHESHWLAGFGQWIGEQLGVPTFCKEACGEVLQWQEGGDIPGKKSWRRRREKCLFIAMTPHIKTELERAGIPADRIWEVPNGVEMPTVTARPEEHDLVVFAGNLYQGAVYKAFDVLLQAFGKACREAPGMKLRLFGSGRADRWKQVAEQEGCGDSVEFAGTTDDLSGKFLQAGFLVLPSRVEGLSNVLLEAQAIGLPAVVSDIGGNVAVVQDGVNGLVVPVGDADALAAAMLKMHGDPELRQRMGLAARNRAAEIFAIEKVAARLESAYRQALDNRLAGTAKRVFED
jgi:glycosyltransferase involved in cell wall biosynthesis